MLEENNLPNFEQAVLPHLDAAYNLARWLTRNDQDAQDAVQEACLRALRFFPTFRGGDARAWLMKIVRNACYTWLRANRPLQEAAEFDEKLIPPDPLRSQSRRSLTARRRRHSAAKSPREASAQFFVKSLFSANSRRCLTGRSQISPACLRAR
jgi:RNA polymerase sigma-70 factor (ECF subfamily)